MYDNFLPDEMVNYIHNSFTSKEFPWYFKNTTTDIYDNSEDILKYEFPFFSHTLIKDGIDNSGLSYIAHDLIKKTSENDNIFGKYIINRAVVNMTLPSKITSSPKHVDQSFPHKVAIYYVNDCDGDTILYDSNGDKTKISPKRGRMIVFNGDIFHSGCSPILSRNRIVVNFNIEEVK
jgi:hypothetical protein